MNVAPAVGIVELVILSIVYSGLGIPLGIPPAAPDATLLQMAPDECLFYASWSGTMSPAGGPSRTEQLLAEPEVQAFLAELQLRFNEAMNEAVDAAPSERERLLAEWGRDVLPLMLTHSASLCVSRLGPTAATMKDLEGGLIVNLGDRKAWAQQVSEQLRETLLPGKTTTHTFGSTAIYTLTLPPPLPPVAWAIWQDYLIMGVGSEWIENSIRRAATPIPEWLVKLQEDLAVPRISLIGYFDIQAALQVASQANPPRWDELVELLGLQHLRAAAGVSGLDDDAYVNRSKLYTDGTMPRVLKSLTAGELSATTLAAIPADANFAAAVNIDLSAAFTTFVDVSRQLSPSFGRRIEAAVSQLGRGFGADLQHDVLGSLGTNWTVFSSPSEGGTFMTGTMVTIEVANQPRLATILDRAIQVAAGSLPAPRQLLATQLEDRTLYTLTGLGRGVPFAPSWCLTDGRLWLSLQPQSLRAALARPADFESLAASSAIQQLLRDEPHLVSLRYVDSRDWIKATYPLLPYVVEGMLNRVRQTRLLFDVSKLPSLPAIVRHIRPDVTYTATRADGIERVTHRTLPGGNISATAPVGVALVLPAVQAARTAARRASSMNNLKQIALAVINYEAAKGRFPTAAIRDKNGQPGLSWRVAVLPYLDQQDLYNKFHLDEPWDSDHNKALIAQIPDVYRSPNSTLGDVGKTNYLAIRSDNSVLVDQDQGIRIRDITDGTSKTILAVEADDDRAVIWTKPDDLSWKADAPQAGLGGLLPGQMFLAVFVDGHVETVVAGIAAETLRAAFTRNGGERLPQGALQGTGAPDE